MNEFLLGPKAKVYNAKILRLYDGQKAALISLMGGVISGIYVYLDNLTIAQKAGSIPNRSSQTKFAKS